MTCRTAVSLVEKAEINAVLGNAENLSIRISGLIDQIAAMRSELFRSVLTKRYVLMDVFGDAAISDVKSEGQPIFTARRSSLRFVYPVQASGRSSRDIFLALAAAVVRSAAAACSAGCSRPIRQSNIPPI